MDPWNLGDSNGKTSKLKWQVRLDEDFEKKRVPVWGPCSEGCTHLERLQFLKVMWAREQ